MSSFESAGRLSTQSAMLVAVLSFTAVIAVSRAAEAQQIAVNASDYLAQGSGYQSLCTDYNIVCIHSYQNPYGEYTIYSAQQTSNSGGALVPTGVDYVARSTGGGPNGGQYFGVIRSLDATAPYNSVNYLRCFNAAGQLCYAPPNSSIMPEAVPQALFLNVVSTQDDINASDANGSPTGQIAGGKSITGLTNMQTVNMDVNTCTQNFIGTVPVDVFASFLYQYNFKGDLGVQNALVIEEVEYNQDNTPGHIERYYYVQYYGRVRSGVFFYDHSIPSANIVTNHVQPTSIMPSEPPNSCPQGTAPY